MPAEGPSSKSQIKLELQQRQRAWLQEVVNASGKSASEIASLSGVSDTTLTRLLNNPDYPGTLSQLTIDRIKGTMRVPGPEDLTGGRRPAVLGFSEAERVQYGTEQPSLARIVKELLLGLDAADAWRLKTDALSAVGYLPGDVVIVDMNRAPQPQDAVCAQIYDWKGGSAETVWRVFTPPFLVGAAPDRTAYRPVLVDGQQVVIKGVIVASLRPHGLSATR